MKINEFAKICGCTKRTLIHYDQIGLLKPAHVLENGYREYELHQIYDMDFISLMQAAGFSLEETRSLFTNYNARFSAFDEAEKRLENQIQKLMKMKNYLTEKRMLAESSMTPYFEDAEFCFDAASIEDNPNHFFGFMTLNTMTGFAFESSGASTYLYTEKAAGSHKLSGRFYCFYITLNETDNDLYTAIQDHFNSHQIEIASDIFVENIPRYFLPDNSRTVKVRVLLREK